MYRPLRSYCSNHTSTHEVCFGAMCLIVCRQFIPDRFKFLKNHEPGTSHTMNRPLIKSAYHAFAAPFALGLILFSLVAFMFSQHSNGISGFLISFLVVPALIGLPWALFTFSVSLLLALLFSFWRPGRLLYSVTTGTGSACTIASVGMYALLREQKNCDSICLGLEQTIIGPIPLYVLIVIFLAAIGGVQGSIIHRLE